MDLPDLLVVWCCGARHQQPKQPAIEALPLAHWQITDHPYGETLPLCLECLLYLANFWETTTYADGLRQQRATLREWADAAADRLGNGWSPTGHLREASLPAGTLTSTAPDYLAALEEELEAFVQDFNAHRAAELAREACAVPPDGWPTGDVAERWLHDYRRGVA